MISYAYCRLVWCNTCCRYCWRCFQNITVMSELMIIRSLQNFLVCTGLLWKAAERCTITFLLHYSYLVCKCMSYVIVFYGFIQVRFVVMGNMFCTELRIHRKYDLKGSTQGRSTKKQNINENTTLKDLDLSYVFHVDKPWRDALFR